MTKNTVDSVLFNRHHSSLYDERVKELQQPNPIISDFKSSEILQASDYDFDKFATAKNSLSMRLLFLYIPVL